MFKVLSIPTQEWQYRGDGLGAYWAITKDGAVLAVGRVIDSVTRHNRGGSCYG